MSNKKPIAFEIPVHTDGKTPVAKPPPSIAKKMEHGSLKRRYFSVPLIGNSLSSEDIQSKLNDAQQRKKVFLTIIYFEQQVLDNKVQKARQQVNKAKTYSAKTRETVEKVVKEKLAHLQGKLDRAVTVKYEQVNPSPFLHEQDKAKKEKIASHLNEVIKKKAAAM